MAAAPLVLDPRAESEEYRISPPSRSTRLIGQHWRVQRLLSEASQCPVACEFSRSIALPAASVRPVRRNCHIPRSSPVPNSTPPPSSPPVASLPGCGPPHTQLPNRSSLPSAPALAGPPCHSHSTGWQPYSRTQPAPYTPATFATNVPAVPLAPVPRSDLPASPWPDKMRSVACFLPHALSPRCLRSPGVHSAALQSPPTLCGSRVSSPACPSALGIECCHPPAIAPDPRSGTSASLLQTGSPQTSPASAPHGSDTHAPVPLQRYTARPAPRSAAPAAAHPVCRSACSQSAALYSVPHAASLM